MRLMHMEKIQSNILTRLKYLEGQQTLRSPSYQVAFNAPAAPIAEPVNIDQPFLPESTTQPPNRLYQPPYEFETNSFPCNDYPVSGYRTPIAQTQPSNKYSQHSVTPESVMYHYLAQSLFVQMQLVPCHLQTSRNICYAAFRMSLMKTLNSEMNRQQELYVRN